MPVPAIIGLIGSVLGAVVSYGLQQQGINDMNQYNSPGASASRLRNAGFSPANVFSQGAPAGVQSLLGNYQNSIGSDAMAAVSASQQGELIKSQKQALESQAALDDAKTIQQLLESDVFREYADKEKQMQLSNYAADLALKTAQTHLTEAKSITEMVSQDLISAQTKETLSRIGVNKATIRQLDSITDLNKYDLNYMRPEQLNKLRSEITNLEKQSDYWVSAAKFNDAQRKTVDQIRNDVHAKLFAEISKLGKEGNLADAMARVQGFMEDQIISQTQLNDEQKEIVRAKGTVDMINTIIKSIPFLGLTVK